MIEKIKGGIKILEEEIEGKLKVGALELFYN